jgi:hypothetical protein
MKKEELLKRLIHLNVNPIHYSIGQEIKDDACNIERLANGQYAVYYLERGEKCGLKVFDNEDEALLELIIKLEFNLKSGVDLTK